MGQNILDLLRQEHAKVLMQLGKLQQREIRDRAELFNQVNYPALKDGACNYGGSPCHIHTTLIPGSCWHRSAGWLTSGNDP